MAARGASILWFFVKWFVIPVGLAAFGFFVVGPRIGKQPASDEKTTESSENAPLDGSSVVRHSSASPLVEVVSRPVSPRKNTRNSRPKPKPKVEEAPKDPMNDPGSAGGTTNPPPSNDPVEPTTGGGGGDGAGLGG